MSKETNLKNLEKEMKRKIKNKILIFGEGNPNSKIVFIGEAGGEQEEKLKRPFVGRAGKFLNKQLEKHSIDRKKVWITNVVKMHCIGPPTEDEIKLFKPFLEKELKIIKPKLAVMLGRIADKNVPRLESIKYFYIPHPSAAMRFNGQRKIFEENMDELKRIIKSLGSK